MAGLSLDDVAWLSSDDGRASLVAAAEVLAADPDPLRAATALRRHGLAPHRAAHALTQARLRQRARARLGADLADRLLLTDDGLAQATRPVVARHRAERLAATGATHVLDVGCGLGLDALSFAAAGLRVTGVERDPVVAALARANATATAAALDVVDGDATDPQVLDALLVRGADTVFADPARRDPHAARRSDGSARRESDPQRWSPPWSWVAGVAGRVPQVVAKLAPGVPRELAPGWELVWTSVDGDLVEAAAWSPALARPGVSRAAVALDTRAGSRIERTDADDPYGEDASGGLAPVGPVGAFLLEPDDAVIRAGLVGAVVAEVDGHLLDRRLAYVTTGSWPTQQPSPARAFRVLDVGSTDTARLRSMLARLGAGDVIVKTRGVQADPPAVRRAMRLTGRGPTLVVLLARLDSGAVAVVAEPV